MNQYRIIEKKYGDGSVKYAVQRQFQNSEEWVAFVHTSTLDEARKIKQERIDRETFEIREVE